MAEQSAVTTDEYFGGCPECGRTDGYRNIERNHWFVCHEHKTKWWIGSNLFSGWREFEDETDWKRNWEELKLYQEVTPVERQDEPPLNDKVPFLTGVNEMNEVTLKDVTANVAEEAEASKTQEKEVASEGIGIGIVLPDLKVVIDLDKFDGYPSSNSVSSALNDLINVATGFKKVLDGTSGLQKAECDLERIVRRIEEVPF